MIRGVRAAKAAPRARSSRGVFPNDCLQGFSDAWHAYLAKGSPFSDTWRANLAGKGRFSRPRPLLGCMERKTCRGLPPGNAPWLHLAMAAPSRMLLDDILPRRPSAARACREIAVAPRSRKTPPERSVGQFNNARRHVQETMKIFWCLSPRNGTENVLA